MRSLPVMVAVVLTAAWSVGQTVDLGALKEAPRTISVTGEALVKVVPDEVVVNFGVQTFAADLDEAKAANDAASATFVRAMKGLKVEDKHLQTDHLNVEVHYKNGRYQLGVEGYTARRGYSVVLKDPALFEKAVDTGLKNGANLIAGFEFRTTELRKHRDEARRLALRAAQEKAVAMGKELGCTVGAPRTINDQGGYYGYWGSRWGGYGGAMSQNVMQDAGGGGGASGGETMPLGQVGVRAQVNVVFDLIPEAAK